MKETEGKWKRTGKDGNDYKHIKGGGAKMKKYLKTWGLGVVCVGLAGFAVLFFASPYQTLACGGGRGSGGIGGGIGGGGAACGFGGSPGGADYVPQQRGSGSWLPGGSSGASYNNGGAMSEDQARNILARHVERLNPELKVGPVEDAGSFYKADIYSKTNEVVDHLAVDKQSGRMMPVD